MGLRGLLAHDLESRQVLKPEAVQPRDTGYVSAWRGPSGFEWLIQGVLGGTRKPGLISSIEADLDALVRVGTGTLVTLTEVNDTPPDLIDAFGLKNLWFPIDDMCTPDLEACYEMVKSVEEIIAQGTIVVYHCKAGLGRTGLMLAAHLVMRGGTGVEALEFTRQRKSKWIQSIEQEEFLVEFERYIAHREGREIDEGAGGDAAGAGRAVG